MKRKAIIISTIYGYEPAFWNEEFQEYVIEPGYASTTREEAEQRLADDLEVARQFGSVKPGVCNGHGIRLRI